MRIAAGIMMIITAILGFVLPRAIYSSTYGGLGSIPGLLGWLHWFWVITVGAGGVYTLKRKLWGLCLTSGILMIPIGIIPFLAWSDVLAAVSGEGTNIPFAIMVTLVFLAIAILPVISVKLRKREWQS